MTTLSDLLSDVVAWWWDGITIAAGLSAIAGAGVAVLAVTDADGWVTVVGVVVGVPVVAVGLWVMRSNWRELRMPGWDRELVDEDADRRRRMR